MWQMFGQWAHQQWGFTGFEEIFTGLLRLKSSSFLKSTLLTQTIDVRHCDWREDGMKIWNSPEQDTPWAGHMWNMSVSTDPDNESHLVLMLDLNESKPTP